MTDNLTTIIKQIGVQAGSAAELFCYYDGDHPLKYSTNRLAKAFNDINAFFAQNWCSVIVDSVLERINLQGLSVAENPAATDALKTLWASLKIMHDAQDVHEASVVTGAGYLIIGRNEEGALEIYENDPGMCTVIYDPASPKRKLSAGKMWADGDKINVDIYLPERIEKYQADAEAFKNTKEKAFLLTEETPNPFGEVPVFHFPAHRRRLVGELTITLISLQDAVNKLLADMMVSAEFTAYKQRVFITNADIGKPKNSPNVNIIIPAAENTTEPTKVMELGGADLSNYLDAIDKLSNSMAIISRTPKHYFFSQGGDPSGDALVAMEAPLVKKAKKYHENFGTVWQEVGTFLLKHGSSMDVPPDNIQPIWEAPETVQPVVRSEIARNYKQAGASTASSLKEAGWDQKKIEDDQQSLADEQSSTSSEAQNVLNDLRKKNAQSNA
jgi:hypothetical protein